MSQAEQLIRTAFEKAGRMGDPKMSEAIDELRLGATDPREDAYWAMAHVGLIADQETLELRPSGVDPSLQAQMKALFDAAREYKAQAAAKEREAHDLARSAVAVKKGLSPARVELSFFHECDGSPTGLCAYDVDSESGTDECIFCGHPDERL